MFAGGTEFTTSSVTPIVDGAPGDESLLKPGQVITLTGSVVSGGTTATASSAAVNDKLIGPVSAIDPASGSFTVLGQTVATDRRHQRRSCNHASRCQCVD